MSIESEIDQAIQSALSSLSITAKFDGDNDIDITIYLDGNELCTTCVEVSQICLTKEP